MEFDFKSCFWDPHDDGVNILLQHISDGIKSLSTLEQFFRSKAEISKDYARRSGAMGEKLKKDISKNPDFGNLNEMLLSLLSVEKARAAAYSKQYELIQSDLYQQIKLFTDNMKASYTTLSGKIENLRKDKLEKRKGCEELAKRLKEAEVKYRDYKLNENNIIGSRKTEQNNREIIKWETNVKEISTQLTVLKHEYKASQKFWLKSWALISEQLQGMEYERISFIQSKLQEYININMETSILEQTKLDFLNNELATFTAWDDIKKFSSDYGTGRLKDKHQKSSTRPVSYASSANRTDIPLTSYANTNDDKRNNLSKRESYMEDIRQLSDQFQRTHMSRNNNSLNKGKQNYYNIRQTETTENASTPHMGYVTYDDEKTLPVIKQRSKGKFNRYSLHESHLPNYVKMDEDVLASPVEKVETQSEDVSQQETAYKNDENRSTPQHIKTHSESSATSSSSNPTDFSGHINRRRRSIESMSTSVTSIASSIDDNQRFAKSWNSTNNRKRKSMSHISSLLNNSTTTILQASNNDYNNITNNTNAQLNGSTGSRPNGTRQNSTNTILMKSLDMSRSTRRKSLVKDPSSNDPIEDAILEMNKLQGGVAKDIRMGRVNDNGVIVTLPVVTRSGNSVIKYAKALYPLLDNNSPEVINFDKNDYLLITEEINEEWYLGEVYDNDKIHPAHKIGLIPYNFIKILD
ncbi:formin-binding protein HOF1 PWA37_005088 [Arxiozyma heterogenica]|uniref:formin-binding protein HOF1 n=1 Tax=Arxiozyma heterogenica TaxID=278026 RepID=UPI002F135BE3